MFDAGDTLGPYTIVRRLGAGAMGEVCQARHRHMGRDVAIKVLRAELTEETDVVNRFFTEARATAAVRHAGIVEIFDCDLHRSGRAFIVMEYLAGEDLAHRLSIVGSFAGDWQALRAIARQLASALAAAHAVGIVHRDLKPGNIFLVGDAAEAPVVKIVDFGIAKLLHRDGGAHSQTQTGHILGTPLYMSPEQARGAKTIDHRTDIYALGCVLFEMITGQPPFVRKGPAEVIVAHLHEPAPRASSLEATVPTALDELVAQMLAKEPDQRPRAMTDVLARLAEPAAAAPGHVSTQLLPGGKASGGSGPVVAPPAPAAPALAAAPAPVRAVAPVPRAVQPASAAPVAARAVAAPTRAGFAGRDAQILARAGSTTLGNSAAELVAATEHVARAHKRSRGLVAGVAALLVAGVVVVIAARSGGRGAGAPTAASAPVANPPAAPAEAPPPSAPAPVAVPAPAVVAAPALAPAPPAKDKPAATTPTRPAPVRHRRAKSDGEFKAIED